MARSLNPDVRTVRRDAILDVAERLIRTRGYDGISIQDVQDELGVSRGAIYHYFDSKAALVEAVVERIAAGIEVVFAAIADDPDLAAPAKLQRLFEAAGAWKAQRRDLLIGLLGTWYSDDNARVRDRLRTVSAEHLGPVFGRIVRQGCDEGSFTATYPDDAAQILIALFNGSSESIGRMFLASIAGTVSVADVERAIRAHNEAIERILGLPAGSFEIIDAPSIRFWLT